jgi:hypothetical protein
VLQLIVLKFFQIKTEIIDYSDIGIKKLAFQLSKGLSKHEIVKNLSNMLEMKLDIVVIIKIIKLH